MPRVRRPRTAWPILYAILGCVALLPLGCGSSDSFSDSSKSSVDSSTSPFRSSSSSSPEETSSAYSDEVRSYTAGYARAGGLADDAYRRQLGEIAKKYGVSNWQDTKATFRAVGEGLGQAGVGQSQVDAYVNSLAAADTDKRKAVQDGYNAMKR